MPEQKITFVNSEPAKCGCKMEFSSGGGHYSDVVYVTPCEAHSGSKPFGPVEVKRDADGWWHHPNIPEFGEGEDPAPYIAWIKEQGLELKGWHSGDETYDLPDEDAACTAWNPESPGPEWFLMGIFDTEDGPYVQWARRAPGLQREVEAVATGKDFCGACADGCGSCQVAEESPQVTP